MADPLDYRRHRDVRLKALQRTYRRDKAALLECVYFCAMYGEPLPEWASRAFQDTYMSIRAGGARSWDDAFGRPHRAKDHLHTKRNAGRRFEVYERVRAYHSAGGAIDDRLFHKVGRELGVGGKTVTKKLYYRVERALRRLAKADEPSGHEN